MVTMVIYLFFSKLVFYGCFEPRKKEQISNIYENALKVREILPYLGKKKKKKQLETCHQSSPLWEIK